MNSEKHITIDDIRWASNSKLILRF